MVDVTKGEEFTCILFLFWNMLPQLCWHISSLSGVGSSPVPIPSLVDQYQGLWISDGTEAVGVAVAYRRILTAA